MEAIMRYLIGIDLGTSGTKTVLFDEDGNTLKSHTVEYPMQQPKNGWAEQDPEDWYRASVETLKAVYRWDRRVKDRRHRHIGTDAQSCTAR